MLIPLLSDNNGKNCLFVDPKEILVVGITKNDNTGKTCGYIILKNRESMIFLDESVDICVLATNVNKHLSDFSKVK